MAAKRTERARSSKVELHIGIRIHDQNVPATAADHLVNAEIVEMPAVRQVDVRAFGVDQSQRFGQKRPECASRAGLDLFLADFGGRIGEPCAETDVKERQSKGCCRRGVVAHARAHGRA